MIVLLDLVSLFFFFVCKLLKFMMLSKVMVIVTIQIWACICSLIWSIRPFEMVFLYKTSFKPGALAIKL